MKFEMLSLKKMRLLLIVLLVLFLTTNRVIAIVDTGTILDVDLTQSKKEFNMYGITGIQIDFKIEVEFIVQVSSATPTIFFEASVRKLGSSGKLSGSLGHQTKVVNNNTKSTIDFETIPLIITASGKSVGYTEVSLKKGDKMVLDLEMYYYAPSETIKTILDTHEEIFYLTASPPTKNLVIVIALGGILLIAAIVILLLIFRPKRPENLPGPF